MFNHGRLFDKLKKENCSVSLLDEKRYNNFQLVQQFICFVRSFRPDIIHTHGHKDETIAGLSVYFSPSITLIRSVHGSSEYGVSWRNPVKAAYKQVESMISQSRLDVLVAVAPHIERELQLHCNTPVRTILNAIDIDEIIESAHKPTPLLDPDPEVFKLGFIGRLVPVKRVDLLVYALAILRSHASLKIKLFIFGDGPLRKELEKKVFQLNLQSTITFMGHKDHIHPYLKQLDLLMMPSDHEGLPMTLLEAMVLQCPIAAHDIGYLSILLENGKCGYLTKEHTANGYANLIQQIIDEPNIVAKKTQRAYQRVKADLNCKSMTEHYLNLYDNINHIFAAHDSI